MLFLPSVYYRSQNPDTIALYPLYIYVYTQQFDVSDANVL